MVGIRRGRGRSYRRLGPRRVARRPPPREVRTDGSRDPAPAAEPPAKAEDPAAVVDRIIKNSKDVGDQLAKTDTGAGTLEKQNKILSDIDALINRQDDPPPPKSDDNKDKDKNKDKDDKDPMSKDNQDPMSKEPMKSDAPPQKGDMPMDKNMGSGKDTGKDGGTPPPDRDEKPMGGGGRKPRMGDPMGGDKKEPHSNDPKSSPMNPDSKAGGTGKEPKDPKNPSGTAGNKSGGKTAPATAVPFEDDVAKDVWGHLPDKLRQQMTQYYKEDVMPKYAELLRLYYSSLSDKGGPPVPPKR
ncbi:hypothetical protein [Frigoriglobus tundricola]|uniref:Uncharacterized protein n=1 Tax=Frigoriglobus tundricola TaxID=2774151 RepID=A0A6M5YZ79_9BACT|nr:hypothetical protein [Frigoriglobus tundricola]QJW98541.1 hypothetical protein FTUN_6136 [Frigoriglobus tundricola]